MQPHTIASYDTDLKALDELVGDMASRAEASLRDAANALFGGDVQLAQRVIAADAAIDLLQHGIEEKALPLPRASPWPSICARSCRPSASPATWSASAIW